jgi:hypothetical protein
MRFYAKSELSSEGKQMELRNAKLGDTVHLTSGKVGDVVVICDPIEEGIIIGFKTEAPINWNWTPHIPITSKIVPNISPYKWFGKFYAHNTYERQTEYKPLIGAQLGDRIRIQNTKDGYSDGHDMDTVIIGETVGWAPFKDMWLLGWKKEEASPYSPLHSVKMNEVVAPNRAIGNFKEYERVLWIDKTFPGINLSQQIREQQEQKQKIREQQEQKQKIREQQEASKKSVKKTLRDARIGDRVRVSYSKSDSGHRPFDSDDTKIIEATVIGSQSSPPELELALLGTEESNPKFPENKVSKFANCYRLQHPEMQHFLYGIGVGVDCDCEILERYTPYTTLNDAKVGDRVRYKSRMRNGQQQTVEATVVCKDSTISNAVLLGWKEGEIAGERIAGAYSAAIAYSGVYKVVIHNIEDFTRSIGYSGDLECEILGNRMFPDRLKDAKIGDRIRYLVVGLSGEEEAIEATVVSNGYFEEGVVGVLLGWKEGEKLPPAISMISPQKCSDEYKTVVSNIKDFIACVGHFGVDLELECKILPRNNTSDDHIQKGLPLNDTTSSNTIVETNATETIEAKPADRTEATDQPTESSIVAPLLMAVGAGIGALIGTIGKATTGVRVEVKYHS